MDVKVRLSTLWIVVMLNLVFADILTIIVGLVLENTLDDIIGEVKTTMAVAAVLTNIPILMIYFSRVLPYKINRSLNIGAAILTSIYVVGGGSLMPHYLICAGIEVVVLFVIIRNAYHWRYNEESSRYS
ncbi:DUF6326 family protein [Maribacter antarcticus]|uniref:DUF6326 family protein n=1 Tax=Maribacter antarcticus TaxID=505250 RepID=UPI0006864BA3|nr:DUF6326 family protein [Maribacter antarcticus]